jgi:cell division protein ZapA (FtsZ GTPase activity inhibitor)
MTENRQSFEIEILGCRVKLSSTLEERDLARQAADMVINEIQLIKHQKPGLKDTDVAVLVALKLASGKLQLETDCKELVLKTESSLKFILDQSQI